MPKTTPTLVSLRANLKGYMKQEVLAHRVMDLCPGRQLSVVYGSHGVTMSGHLEIEEQEKVLRHIPIIKCNQ